MRPQLSAPNPRQRKKKRKKKRRSPRRRAPRIRATELRAPKKQSTHPEFVELFSLRSRSTWPLPLILDVETAPSPKRHFRSCYRLARLVPHGSKSWKKRTRWRNTAKGRNSSLQSKGLLRFPDYGLHHGTLTGRRC